MKRTRIILYRCLSCLCLLSAWSCTEKITMDLPQGRKVPVVEGSITNEYKRHEIIMSYSSEVYSEEREMIPGAEIYLVGGGDTIYYYEQPDKPGHYLTDSVAGLSVFSCEICLGTICRSVSVRCVRTNIISRSWRQIGEVFAK